MLDKITKRAHYYATQMIHLANNRKDKEKGDPKIGGHPAACASCVHLLGALHLVVKSGFDHLAVKPHASPNDHSFNYLLNLFLDSEQNPLEADLAEKAMHGLRKFSQDGEPVFQSYHSAYDSDHHGFLPSGTVGIPPVNLGYLALAYDYAKEHSYEVPKAHFWSLIGDSEFREGSLYEAMPDFAERELGNLTWIIDYNRQSLDGQRIINKEIMGGNDNYRIARTAEANGWHVIEIQHGQIRKRLFESKGGDEYKKFLEEDLIDFELQALLLSKDGEAIRKELLKTQPKLKTFLDSVKDSDLIDSLKDFGGHDFDEIIQALEASKKETRRPTIIIAHTLKGWELEMAAKSANHSLLPSQEEIDHLRNQQGISESNLFEKFKKESDEAKYLQKRGQQLLTEIKEQYAIKSRNAEKVSSVIQSIPDSLDINLKMVNYPHTQWMLGQLTAKLTRISNTNNFKNESESAFRLPGELLVSMAPDVGTSTNLNPAMDGKIFGAVDVDDYEAELEVKDKKSPDLIPGEDVSDRFLRFEIAEANAMSCAGSFGKMRDLLGIPLIPLMTVYDFFIKRALDQYFYNLYWKSSFLLVGTPAGVTLSPEGAQHGWKSDFQIPNQITWEPFFCQELDWILVDSLKKHLLEENDQKTGVLVRGSTRGVDQKHFMKYLKRQSRFKSESNSSKFLSIGESDLENTIDEASLETVDDSTILAEIRNDVLQGAYYLIDYRGYAGYEPGDNVVHLFSMGSPTTEAIDASEELLKKGIFANVIVITSPDLLIGNLGHQNGYFHLKENLNIDANLYFQPHHNGAGADRADLITLAGRRIPIVSIHDGEPGLLDNIGSIIGTRHESLAVRKHSKSGRPSEIYRYHGIDKDSIIETVGKVLSETAIETVKVSPTVLHDVQGSTNKVSDWRELWPQKNND